MLDQLAALPNVDVTLISGRKGEDLEAFAGKGRLGSDRRARCEPASARSKGLGSVGCAQVNYGWKDEVRPVFRLYEESLPGSQVEEKRTSLVWHYRRADPEFGEWKANQLAEELGAMTANTPVQVRQGRKIVEAVSAQVSKGAAVARCMGEEGYALACCAPGTM